MDSFKIILTCLTVLFLWFGVVGFVESKKNHYKAGSILLLIIAAFIAYGLYTQCHGVAVYRRC